MIMLGQDGKKILSVAVYNHYKRLENLSDDKSEVELFKSNIMMIGSTSLVKLLLRHSKTADFPLVMQLH